MALLGLIGLSIFLGRYPSAGLLRFSTLQADALAQNLVLNLRLPRIIAALLLGMGLAGAGMVFQTLFGNPLVEPGFLGVSQGAAFGAAFSILFFAQTAWALQGFAILFALLGLGASTLLAKRIHYGGWVLRLVLAGIAVSALFSSGVGVLKYIADPQRQLPEITFWMLGGLTGVTWQKVFAILPLMLAGFCVVFIMRWRLNLLALNDETAFSLGAAPQRERLLLIFVAVLMTALVVSIAGMVGWVGLIIPHVARRMFGADTRLTLPASMLMGAMFVLVCDDLARVALPGEIPLGILTALLGALGFILLLSARKVVIQR